MRIVEQKPFAMITVIIFTLMSLANAAIYKDGPCPNVQPVKYLNLTAYANSIWYEIAKYPNELEKKGDCTYLAFKQEDGVIKFQLGEVNEKHFESFDGYVDYAPNSGTTGLLYYKSFNFEEEEKTDILPVYVLAVDYDHYFIGYECMFNKSTNKRHEFAWIKSRTKTLDAKTKAAVDNFLKKSTVIDTDKLSWDHFDPQACSMET